MREQATGGGKNIMITSVFPVKVWKDCVGYITVADSILDRIVPRAWHIDLKEPSM